MIVYAEWLYNRIVSRISCDADVENPFGIQVIQTGNNELEDYQLGHIPGAIYLDTNSFEHAPTWNLVPDDQLEQVLLSHGIHMDKTLVLYGKDRLAVSRAALVLLYAGAGDVRILWDGIGSWKRGAYPIETGENRNFPLQSFAREIPAHPEYIIHLEHVRSLLADKNAIVACVRGWDEFIGLTSGYDYIQPKGRIPGSIWAALPGDEGLRDQRSQTPEASAQLLQEIAAGWDQKGLSSKKKIAFYCGTGWRASEAFLYASWLGWKDISIYDGGWLEWSAQAENPIEVGEP
jgi:molybdopterin synthase sulfurtransferase